MSALNRDSLLAVYNRFTGLVEKLPGGLQKPILRELTPIRELFLEQRPARVLLVGGARRGVREILESFGAKDPQACGSDNGWRTYRVEKRGDIEFFDARADVSEESLAMALEQIGDPRAANLVLLGAWLRRRPLITPARIEHALRNIWSDNQATLERNLAAFQAGWALD